MLKREHSDGSWTIRYEDGDEETRVEARRIRKKDRSRSRSRSGSPKRGRKLREGAKIEARYRGRSKWQSTAEKSTAGGLHSRRVHETRTIHARSRGADATRL